MDLGALYHFLFQTYAGIGVLVGICLVLSLLVAFILELRTRRRFSNHEATDDDWSFFDDDDDNAEDAAGEKAAKDTK